LFPFEVGQFGMSQADPFHFQPGEQTHVQAPPLTFAAPFPLQSFAPV
jgi:hypothetical protein